MEIETHVHERKRENRAARCDRLTLYIRSVRKGGREERETRRNRVAPLIHKFPSGETSYSSSSYEWNER